MTGILLRGHFGSTTAKVICSGRSPIPPSVAPYLESYLPQRQNRLLELGLDKESALFVTRSGKRLSGIRVSAMAAIGLPRKRTPHSFLFINFAIAALRTYSKKA